MLWWTIRQLRSSTADTRAAAASKLGYALDRRALGPLIKAISDPDSYVRLESTEALNRIDPGWRETTEARATIPHLIKALKHPDEKVRWVSAGALGEVGDPRAVEVLDATIHSDTSYHVQRMAISALHRIKDDRVVGLLVALLRHDLAEDAAYCLHRLEWKPSDDATNRLYRSAICCKALSVEYQCTSCFRALGGGVQPGFPTEEEMVLRGLTLDQAREAERTAEESALYRGQVCSPCFAVLCYQCHHGGMTDCPHCGRPMVPASGKSLRELKGLARDVLWEARHP